MPLRKDQKYRSRSLKFLYAGNFGKMATVDLVEDQPSDQIPHVCFICGDLSKEFLHFKFHRAFVGRFQEELRESDRIVDHKCVICYGTDGSSRKVDLPRRSISAWF